VKGLASTLAPVLGFAAMITFALRRSRQRGRSLRDGLRLHWPAGRAG
jgi:hypothetical protein